MIIHIWMHWFWITTSYFKEAGLLDPTTALIPSFLAPHETNSSQFGRDPNITSPISDPPPDNSTHFPSTPPPSPSTGPQEVTNTEDTTTSKPDDVQRTAFESTSDTEDTYNGGTLDVFQYPLKKFTKYSHLKYGKVRGKGASAEEMVKVIEENINISIKEDGVGRSAAEVDKAKEGSEEGGETPEIPTSGAPDLITTTLPLDAVNDTDESSTKTFLEEPKEALEVLKNETLVIESKVEESRTFTTVEPFVVRDRVAAATSAQNYEFEQSEMNAGSITGITLGILVVFSLFGAVSFVLYRRRYLNKPQVLHDKCSNLDSSGYIDEASLRENSEEMYSLDNDSFLNSLEAMTIQNYWTENVKHTKL